MKNETDTLSFQSFELWRSAQCEDGRNLVSKAFSYIANKYNAHILCNPTNPTSYSHFLRNDVQSKTYEIRDRTARHGFTDGFIPFKEPYQKRNLNFCIEGNLWHAVTRNGNEVLTRNVNSDDTFVRVSAYTTDELIISDIDLLFILLKIPQEDVINDTEYGQLNLSEKTLITDLNNYFHDLKKNQLQSQNLTTFKLVSHGPANRFSGSKFSHIHYPITIFSPGNTVELGCETNKEDSLNELLTFLDEKKKNGYLVDLNPNWGII